MLAREGWTVHDVCLLSLSRMREDKISKLLSIYPEYQWCRNTVQNRLDSADKGLASGLGARTGLCCIVFP